MSQTARAQWQAGNQAFLTAEIERIRHCLEHGHARAAGLPAQLMPAPGPASFYDAEFLAAHEQRLAELLQSMPDPPSLHALCEAYALTPFERDVLLLCAAVELDAASRSLCSKWTGGVAQPTVGLALSALPQGNWSAVCAGGPLRAARLIAVNGAESLTRSSLRIEESVLCYLLGLSILDKRLQGLVRRIPPPLALGRPLPRSQRAVIQRIHDLLVGEQVGEQTPPAIWLCGPDAGIRRMVAAQVCEGLGVELYVLRAADLPAGMSDRDELIALWDREQLLGSVLLLLSHEDSDPPDALRAAATFVEQAPFPIFLSSREPMGTGERQCYCIDLPRPNNQEQRELWCAALGPAAPAIGDSIDQVASQFQLDLNGIASVSAQALGQADSPAELPQILWNVCRIQSRPKLDELAKRVEPSAGFDDLVLPAPQLKMLRALVAHQR